MDTQRELIEGLLQFVTLAESERKLLAADLHDQTLSDLRELARIARRLSELPDEKMSPEVRDGLGYIVTGLGETMNEVRRAMENLSPSALDTLGLLPALENCLTRAASASERPFATRFACMVKEEEVRLTEIEQLLVYRIVQEAINNISSHARARAVELLVARVGDDLFIRVVDDGCGMTQSGELGRARGLENMRYRARLIGANLTWLRGMGGQGTAVEVYVPMKG